jgi:hypothetical protein
VTEFVLNNFPFYISIDPYASSGIFAFFHKRNKFMMYIPVSESQHGPMSIVTTLWAGRLGNLGLIPLSHRVFVSTSSHQLRVPPTFLSSKYGGFFLSGNQMRCRVDH